MKFKQAKNWLSATGLVLVLSGLGAIGLNSKAFAHAVVFENGIAVMGHHQGKTAGFEVVYSPTYWSGVGFEAMRHKDSAVLLGKATALLWRGNYPDYQSNLYLGLGAGRQWARKTLKDKSDPTMPMSDASLYQWNAGWDGEDRQIYSVVHFSQTFDPQHERHDEAKFRLGLAPYKAKNDEPTFWGILEWAPEKYAHDKDWKHEVTPMVRYFYKNALIEIGSSLSGKFTFNYMFHFFN
jgi:hypothetical protein